MFQVTKQKEKKNNTIYDKFFYITGEKTKKFDIEKPKQRKLWNYFLFVL